MEAARAHRRGRSPALHATASRRFCHVQGPPSTQNALARARSARASMLRTDWREDPTPGEVGVGPASNVLAARVASPGVLVRAVPRAVLRVRPGVAGAG